MYRNHIKVRHIKRPIEVKLNHPVDQRLSFIKSYDYIKYHTLRIRALRRQLPYDLHQLNYDTFNSAKFS